MGLVKLKGGKIKIQELIDEIRNKDLVLPEFQREYVWTKDQAKKLMDSLIKGYPIGSFLFWKTNNSPDLKNIEIINDTQKTYQIILDGQQRLTALYLLIEGEIPNFYKEREIEFDPRDLYFNLETSELMYYKPSEMKDNPIWISVIKCFKTNINIIEIAQKIKNEPREQLDLINRFNNNLLKLKIIKERDIPGQTIPSQATLDESIDIFDLVNRQGTKLTDTELALTHITGKWPDARKEMKKKIEELEQHNFFFDLDFMTRGVTAVVTERALFDSIHNRPKEELKQGWGKLLKIIDYLTNVLPGAASIDSNKDLSSSNTLIPIIAYLSHNDGKFKNEKIKKHAIHWLYAASTWARYSSQTDQKLEKDISIIISKEFPWDSLISEIIDERGRIDVKAADFEGRGPQNPLYRMVYILAKVHQAIDWFNGLPLGKMYGDKYELHHHHIFPQSILYKSGYNRESHLDRKKVNEIANIAFLTAETNLEITNKYPEEYLPEIEENYPNALKKQFIPLDKYLWKIENYEEFLSARREIIAKKINDYMNSLILEPTEITLRQTNELIKRGESLNTEFKSTLQWDMIQEKTNTNLRFSVLKTVVAFLNSEGGTLIIGVEDDGNIIGIEKDLKVMGKNPLDKFNQLLSSLIQTHIGAKFISLIKVNFEEVEGNKICVIDVDKSPEPAYLISNEGNEFYIRSGTTSRSLDPSETVGYINMHW